VSYAADERDLAKLHMKRLLESGLGGSLLLFDRGYPSAAFLSHTLTAGFAFVMRVGIYSLTQSRTRAGSPYLMRANNSLSVC